MFNIGDMIEIWTDDSFYYFYSHDTIDSDAECKSGYKLCSFFILGKVYSQQSGVYYMAFHRDNTDDNMNMYITLREDELVCHVTGRTVGKAVNPIKHYNNIPNFLYGQRPCSFDNHIVKLDVSRDISTKKLDRYGELVCYEDMYTDCITEAKIVGSYLYMSDINRGIVDGSLEYVVQYKNKDGDLKEDSVCEMFLQRFN